MDKAGQAPEWGSVKIALYSSHADRLPELSAEGSGQGRIFKFAIIGLSPILIHHPSRDRIFPGREDGSSFLFYSILR